MNILISGGTGFIGSFLSNHFIKKGDSVWILTRNLSQKLKDIHSIKYITELDNSLPSFDVIINLAGKPLRESRWNDNFKKSLIESRLSTTKKIVDFIQRSPNKPSLFISASAIGYYGNSANEQFTEYSSPKTQDFPHTLCEKWEAVANEIKPSSSSDINFAQDNSSNSANKSSKNIRVVNIRLGIVLEKTGGALKEMYMPFSLGLGATLGNGQQWMSWIHMEDVIKSIDWIIKHENLVGPINLTAPNPVNNNTFSKCLASILHRPLFLRFPSWLVKIMFGEMGMELLLKGQNVIPQKLLESGYTFKYPFLENALQNLFQKPKKDKK